MSKLPTKAELLEWIRENPQTVGKREISRAFGLKSADRVELKRLLRELEDDGAIQRHRRSVRPRGALPPVTIMKIVGSDSDGDLFAEPAEWEDDGPPPRAMVVQKRGGEALATNDRVLAKLRPVTNDSFQYEARPIKKITASERRLLGIYRQYADGGRVEAVDKRASREWMVPIGEGGNATDGDLVEAEAIPGARMGLPRGRVVEIHGDPGAARQVSLIAMVQHGIDYEFPADVQAEAETAEPVEALGNRTDLRDLPLITIDPADARDHDDAVCAMADDDPTNPEGHIVWVAIADVAHYVRPGSRLDREARRRGNSTYFPDRVSPMLPVALSGDLCSLHEGVERPCMAVRMVLNAQGEKVSHRFVRGLMRSPASLSYETAQAAVDGEPACDPAIAKEVLQPLFAAYRAAAKAREERQPLDLDFPERRIVLNDAGEVSAIAYRDRMDAHRLIEEFMILANVCAAETLEAKRTPVMYRVHEEPSAEKLDQLREMVEVMGLSLAKGQVLKTRHFNQLLTAAHGTEHAEAVAMSVLRTQTQAYYAPRNFGHFGLNLARYGHFTSPIRRYADLIVHRALIRALEMGDDGLTDADIDVLEQTAEHISMTERRSMEAERDTVDRYVAAYLSDREGAEFEGRIAGVSRAGVFVRLEETGADGLVPISTLGSDYFRHDRETQTLTGDRTGRVLGLGMRASVRLLEATPISGGLIFELLSVDGQGIRSGERRGRGKPGPRRKLSKSRIKNTKTARLSRRRT